MQGHEAQILSAGLPCAIIDIFEAIHARRALILSRARSTLGSVSAISTFSHRRFGRLGLLHKVPRTQSALAVSHVDHWLTLVSLPAHHCSVASVDS